MKQFECKYEVSVLTAEKRQKIPNDVKKELRASGMVDDRGRLKLNGVSPRMLKRMKQEYVGCPVLKENIHFIQCFICPNFQSRISGKILCKGDPL